MSNDDVTSPGDPEWVDAIVRRALERAAAEPTSAPAEPAPVPPVVSAPAIASVVEPSSDASMASPPTVSADLPGFAINGDGPVAAAVATPAPAPAPVLVDDRTSASAYPFDSAGDVDEELFEDALALDETHDAAVSSRMRSFLEWGAVIVGALAVALLIKTFLMQAYYIPSGSMVHTLEIEDRVLVNKLSYAVGDVTRGDLIVFERPPTQPEGEPDLIKRVVGLGGETIEFRDGQVFIRQPGSTVVQLLEEPYLDEGVTTSDFPAGPLPPNCELESPDTRACTIPEGQLFMMGDNRGGSRDSRYFGPIDEDLVVGRAFLRVWPLGRLGFL